ncbi:type II secretion system protein GspG [Tahibacter sp. UC22_41]|uniref:type II secretion system protein GspG n=1 Tax=Tahibacter sp. UC22_41 TaxID=3350178 RepID=UPI0036D91161
MSVGMRVAAWLAWQVFAVLVVFLLWLVLVAAAYSCTRDCDYTFNASEAGAWKLAMSIEAFQLDCGRLPDRLDELTGEARSGTCAVRPWAKASDLRDAYGTRFVYWRSDDGSTFEVRGIGRDRVYGSADDVTTADWTWPWPEPFWRRRPWNCVIATLPWFSIPLGPPLWLMVAIVRRIHRTARRRTATGTD